jgi:hypothetical protein
MRIANLAAGVALIAALGFAWWSSEREPHARDPHAHDVTAPVAIATGGSAMPVSSPPPFEPYAHSQVGDWRAYDYSTRSSLGNFSSHVIARVTAATPDTVTVVLTGRLDQTGEQRAEPADTYPRAFGSIDKLVEHVDWKIFDVALATEPHAVNGKTFACTRISFAKSDPLFPNKRTHVDLWLSPEVLAGAIVEEHEVQQLDDMTFEMRSVLTGYGTGGGATAIWGSHAVGL